MSSRPRRSAATKANEVISVHARWADSPERSERSMSSRRSGRASGVSVSRDGPSSPGGDRHLSLTVKVPSNRLRQATRGDRGFEGGEIVSGKRNRGAKKSYVVDSSPDEDEEEEEEEAEIEVEEEDDDDMDVDAEGEEDADGDIDMDVAPPTITVSKPVRTKAAPRASAAKVIQDDDDDDDDDLSDPADSLAGDETMGFGDETMADDGDEDAEGEEIEVAGPEMEDEDDDEEDEEEDEDEEDDAEGAEDDEDDEEGNPDESIDLTKMTKRQRARFEDDNAHQYMKLSDEVQAKKVFTAEELSMRRQEMARRRRNLSEKRNEEVKMETINKLLKKQAPKVNRKAAAGASEDANRPHPVFVRWISNKNGVRVAVTEEMLDSPAGNIFKPAPKMPAGKMVQEVA
ncbi:PAPA-1-like conserved region-domain-containing protein [Fusarium acuminatum]|uniref:PAPA-1-like conserved region-domain-containing protein n=1 Tax=Fusarium acuminatum TaxID=5515 RepID=A0ABZ2X521_9HYPO